LIPQIASQSGDEIIDIFHAMGGASLKHPEWSVMDVIRLMLVIKYSPEQSNLPFVVESRNALGPPRVTTSRPGHVRSESA